ncbi:hypothetical protein [Legionella tucsonensis]|uniref:Uncharacterized protein n=1 Tax=Legionella tucsonensis TaxID=40335 RepID=A0A0W0ZVQ1_9GAMM|nr:hypothetical protein [Legionella tucsonensis]KTD73227.1 hypothetical protein Ltuc_1074 [Legionella tucsonensis]
MPKIKVTELEDLERVFKNKLGELNTAPLNSHAEMNKCIIKKLVHDLGNLVIIAKASSLSEMPMLDSAAGNMYQNVKSLSEKLELNDPEILKFLNNTEFSQIPPLSSEEFDDEVEFSDDEGFCLKARALCLNSKKEDPKKSGEKDIFEWDEGDSEEEKNPFNP